MKQIFTLALLLALAVSISAQKVNPGLVPAQAADKRNITPEENAISLAQGQHNLAMAGERGGGDFFYEDFANGIAGNNGFGSWTIDDSGDDTIWMLADDDSPAGEWDTGSEPLASETTDNGWMIFDGDRYNEPNSPNYVPVFGYLISPVLDCSALTSVLLDYQHYMRYCCYGYSPIYVEVTNDGGSTWAQYDALRGMLTTTNNQTANPVLSVIDISCSAAGQAAVQFRFGWLMLSETAGNSHYFWGVDDVRMYENPADHDIQIDLVTNGDIFNDYEFRAIPLEQAVPTDLGGLIIGTVYSNWGSNDEEATVEMQLLDEDDVVVSTWSLDVDSPQNMNVETCPDQQDTLFFNTGWVPTGTGEYTVVTSVNVTDDTNTDNNSKARTFFYTDDQYGHDEVGNTGTEARAAAGSIAGTFDPTGYGSYFTTPNDGSTAYGMLVKFGPNTDTGTPFNAILYERGEDYNLTDAELVAGSDEYEVLNPWTPNGNTQVVETYIPFEDPTDLLAGRAYFGGVLSDYEDSEFELTLKATGEFDEDFSTGYYGLTSDGDWIWFFGLQQSRYSPGVRLALSDMTGVDETNLSYLNTFSVSPNPATTSTAINVNLNATTTVAYEVRDITGKLVTFHNEGQLPAGSNVISISTENWAVGTYTLSLVMNGNDFVSRKLEVVR